MYMSTINSDINAFLSIQIGDVLCQEFEQICLNLSEMTANSWAHVMLPTPFTECIFHIDFRYMISSF